MIVQYCPGDSAALNAEILGLMRSGAKTASCEALAYFEETGEPLPVPGRVDIALDWARRPALATETLALRHLRFDEMTEADVAAQGEFRDLAHWREGYRAYLTRAGRYAPETPMILETFRVVRDFAAPEGEA